VVINVLNNDDFGGDGAGSEPLAITQEPEHGAATVNDGGTSSNPTDDSITYAPGSGFAGNDRFVYQICDADGDCAEAKVSIKVEPAAENDTPQATNDSVTTKENTPVTINVLENDSFGNDGPGSVSVTKDPSHGRAVISDNGTANDASDDAIVYTPENGYVGGDAFEYQICDADGDCAEAKVSISVLGLGNDEEIYLYAAGDIAWKYDYDEQTAKLIEKLSEGKKNVYVLALGDLAYEDGKLDEFKKYYDSSWGEFKKITYPTPGNHEYHTTDAKGYFEYWGSRAHGPEGWYSLELGSWKIYSFNTSSNCKYHPCDSGSKQYDWLKGELADNPDGCALAFAHHPRYSPGSHGDNEEIDDMWDLLVDAGVELYLSGHDHVYARYKPRDAQGKEDKEKGLVQFVIGTGGIGLYDLNEDEYVAYSRNKDFGVLELTLRKNSYSWRFVNIDNEVLDSGKGTCH